MTRTDRLLTDPEVLVAWSNVQQAVREYHQALARASIRIDNDVERDDKARWVAVRTWCRARWPEDEENADDVFREIMATWATAPTLPETDDKET